MRPDASVQATPDTDSQPTQPGGRLPDFFIVGQPKSGTTALYEVLKEHPQIFLPDRKEPRFFVSEMLERDTPRPGGTPKTLAEYMSWFEDARVDQLVGEASPWYLWSPTAAARIAATCPDARIIAILREPASLVRSLHMEFLQLYVEVETDLRRAVALEDERRHGRGVPPRTYWPRMLQYAEHARLVEQLRRFEQVFSPERMLVLIYDDFRADNEATIERILRFLGVEESVPLSLKDANPTVRVRSVRAQELVHHVTVGRGPLSRALKAAVKAVSSHELRRGALETVQRRVLWTEPDPPDPEFTIELRRRFKPEVVALSEHLGRDLVALWGYEDLG
jgi:hypothetical protein